MTFDTRVLTFLLWGGGTLIVYGIVLWRAIIRWNIHRDVRARRELVIRLSLFITAFAAACSIAFVLFDGASTIRAFLVALSLGAFSGAGIVMASEDRAQHD